MKIHHHFLSFLALILPLTLRAVEIQPHTASSNATPIIPAPPVASLSSTSTAISPASSPVSLPASSAKPSPTASSTPSPTPAPLISRALPEIHATILLPKEWTLLPGKLLQGDVLLATREKITNESDPWSTGLSMTIDRNGAKDSGQKASVYALGLAREAHEKAGDEATPLKESQSGSFHEIRFDFPIPGEPPLLVSEVLRANDTTGTLAVILWQSPKEESAKLQDLRENILAGIKLDPAQ